MSLLSSHIPKPPYVFFRIRVATITQGILALDVALSPIILALDAALSPTILAFDAALSPTTLALDAALSPTIPLSLPSSSLTKQIIEWGICSSGTLHSFDLWLVANVSRQPIGFTFKGQAVKEEMDCLNFEDG